jgi:hypothetical protein
MLASAILALALISIPVAANADYKESFMRTFPKLTGFDDPTTQQIADLAQTQQDPNADAKNNPDATSGYTYFGQFLDHDLTRDTSPPPTSKVDISTLTNERTFAFDLDSVYGKGPKDSPELYESDGKHLKLQENNPNGVRDLPRKADGSAIIGDPRNDENQIISQFQVAFIKAHNKLVDQGMSFEDARATLRLHYRMAIKEDFLPHTISNVDPNDVKKLESKKTGTPIEFSVAAYRFGHSQVRLAYRLNGTNNCQNLQVLSLTAPDASLMGGRQLQAGRQINWGQFFDDLPQPAACAALPVVAPASSRNLSRQIDPLISASLFRLPIPGAEATGSNVLAFRNMTRGEAYDLPSGQDVAKELGQEVITPEELNLGPGFEKGTPLWYYILAESEKTEGGKKLGPTGSLIVKAGFDSAMTNAEKTETGHAVKKDEIIGSDGKMTITDILRFAEVT